MDSDFEPVIFFLFHRENNGEDEPNWGTLYTYKKIPQQNPLYNYYILIKTLIKKRLRR
jgi:hypothetical protein